MTEYEYTNIIWFEKSIRIRIRILFGLENQPNTNIIWLEKIDRIRILVLGLNYSNNVQIPNYLLTPASHEVHHDIIHGVPHTNVIRFEEKS